MVPEKYIDGRAVEHLKLLVEEVNSTLDIRDKLSDNVYYFDAKTCKLSIADGNERNKVDAMNKTKTVAKGR
ncbi:MAG: hypothetical protein IJZ96_09060, partial [Lachnospiraceae bacterium]|nr:hypothetical protein [Lachnospiraceae bacterium]